MATFEQLQALQLKGTDAFLRGLKSVINPIGDMISTEITLASEITVSPIGRSIGPWRQWTGDRQAVSAVGTSHLITSLPWEKTVSVNRVKLDTDNTGIEMLQFEELGKLSARWRDQLVMDKLIAGETGLCYDGQPFFSAAHPADGDAAAFANLSGSGTAPWYVLDLSSSLKPMVFGALTKPELTHKWSLTDDNVFFQNEYISGVYAHGAAEYGMPQAAYKCKGTLDATNFESALTSIMQRVDNKGQSLGLGQDILVLVPSVLAPDAKRLFGRSSLGDDGDNIHSGIRWAVAQRLPNS